MSLLIKWPLFSLTVGIVKQCESQLMSASNDNHTGQQWSTANGPLTAIPISFHCCCQVTLDFKLVVVDPAAHKSWPLKLSTLYFIVHIGIQKPSKPLEVAPVLHNIGTVLGTMSHGQIMVEMFKWWSHGRLVSLSEGRNAYKVQCATFFWLVSLCSKSLSLKLSSSKGILNLELHFDSESTNARFKISLLVIKLVHSCCV